MSVAVIWERAPRVIRGALLGLLAAVTGTLLALGGASPALAHADLLSSSPEDGAVLSTAPSEVELVFNEPVQLVEGATRLFPGDGTPRELDARVVDTAVVIELPVGLIDGSYALSYRVVSADGHPVGGAITFQLGSRQASGPAATPLSQGDPVITETLVSLLTFTQYLGLLVFAGWLFFDVIVLRRTDAPSDRHRRMSGYALAAAISASFLLLPATAARVAGEELVQLLPDSGDLVLLPMSAWLPSLSWPVVAVAGTVTLAGLVALAVAQRAGSQLNRLLAVGSAAIALLSPVLVGHTQTVQPTWLMQFADAGHLLAGAFWVGGVVGLLRFLAIAQPAGPDEPGSVPAVEAAAVVARFSRFALYSVGLLAVSGVTMGYLVVGSWETLFASAYGQLLLIKLGLVALVVVLAACNRLAFLPRIVRLPSQEQQWRRLRRTLAWEAWVLVAAVAVTGFLTNHSPNMPTAGSTAQPVSQQGVELVAESQGLTVTGMLEPALPGSNTVTVHLEYDGKPVSVADVRVEARLPEQALGPLVASPRLLEGTGDYEATLSLPVRGEWQIQVLARIDTYAQPIAVIPVVIE